VEQPVLGRTVPLGGEQARRPAVGHLAADEVDVGLFAGLEDAEVGVDGGECGHHPVGPRPRAVQDAGGVPRGPVGIRVLVGRGRRCAAPVALQELRLVVERRIRLIVFVAERRKRRVV